MENIRIVRESEYRIAIPILSVSSIYMFRNFYSYELRKVDP